MLLAALSAFVLFDWPLSLSVALMLYAATVAVNLMVQYVLLRGATAFARPLTPRIENPRSWIATGMFLLPTRMVNDNAKIIMIVASSAVLPLEQVALITVALSISGLLNFAISSVEIAFSAKLSRALHSGQRERATKFLAVAGGVKVLACGVMVLVVLFLLEPLLNFFGRHYIAADDITLILLCIPLIQALFGKADLVLLVHDLRNRIFWVQLLTLIILPLSALVAVSIPDTDSARLTSIGFVIAFFVGYGGLWLVALLKTGIDTSTPGAILRMMRDPRKS